MKKIKERNADNRLTVDVETLAGMLSVGRVTANKIGDASGASIKVGRRKLYNVSKVEQYINSL